MTNKVKIPKSKVENGSPFTDRNIKFWAEMYLEAMTEDGETEEEALSNITDANAESVVCDYFEDDFQHFAHEGISAIANTLMNYKEGKEEEPKPKKQKFIAYSGIPVKWIADLCEMRKELEIEGQDTQDWLEEYFRELAVDVMFDMDKYDEHKESTNE